MKYFYDPALPLASLRCLGRHLFLWLAFFGTVAQAQPQALQPVALPTPQEAAAPVAVTLSQWRVTTENGKEVLKPVQSIKPGDVIEYRATYLNRSSKPVTDVQAELPLPEGLQYQARSARPEQTARFAVKGGSFAREPLMRPATDGKTEPVPLTDYRQLRWSLGQLAPGAKADVSVRAVLPPLSSASVADASPAARPSASR